jgi:predicted nucleic acid-binding protein
MTMVIDSSVTLAWLYDDERTNQVERIFDRVVAEGAWVPGLWRPEIANGLQQAIRRRRIDAHFRTRAIANLIDIDISIDQETATFAWTGTLLLSDRFGLTPYDACYLELAQRRALPLATLDRALGNAARQINIHLLGV